MRSLVVLLPLQPATAATEFAYVLTQDGRTAGAHASVPAALLPLPSGAGAEVVAIAPATAVSWHQVELPRGTTARSPRLRAVLEGLLEDKLLDEPEALHFAVQPQPRPGAPVWVAVCDRAWLRSALQVLESAQRPAARIVPEFVPGGPAALHALGEPHDAVLVATGDEGVLVLPLSAAAVALLPGLPEDTPCAAEPAVAALAEQMLPPQSAAAAGAAALVAGRAVAVGSGARGVRQLRPRAHLQEAGRRMGAAAACAAVAASALGRRPAGGHQPGRAERLGLEGARGARIQARGDRAGAHADLPPGQDRGRTRRCRWKRKWRCCAWPRASSSGNDLETMLGVLSAAAPAQPVTAIEFNASGLRVKGPAPGPELAMRLKGQGYAVQPQGDFLLLTPEAAQ